MNPRLIAIAAVLGLLVLGVGGWLLMDAEPQKSDPDARQAERERKKLEREQKQQAKSQKPASVSELLAATPNEQPAQAAAPAPVATSSPLDTAAPDLHLQCYRFRTKCLGQQCYDIGEVMPQDPEQRHMKVAETERVEYSFLGNHAREHRLVGAEGAKTDYYADYAGIERTPTLIKMTTKSRDGAVTDTTEIHLNNKFYAFYAIHSDGTIKEVPLGVPYTAYFGWCDTIGANTTIPAEPAAAVVESVAVPVEAPAVVAPVEAPAPATPAAQ